MRFLIVVLLLALSTVAVFASSFLTPTINNYGFEEVTSGNDAPGWNWLTKSADAHMRSSTDNPHSGKRCLVITNNSSREPDVYGRLEQGVTVLPGIEYELSVWVRSEAVASPQDFTDWQIYSLPTPTGNYGWQKISVRFKTKDDQTSLNLGINIVDKCKELAIDDIILRPIGTAIKGKGITGQIVSPGRVNGDNKPAYLGILINSERKAPATVEAVIYSGKEVIFKTTVAVNFGMNTLDCDWNTGTAKERQLNCAVRVLDGKTQLASGSRKIEKISGITVMHGLDTVEAKLPEFNALYKKCQSKNIPIDYPRVTKTLLEQYIPWTREDVKKHEEPRAAYAVSDLNIAINDAIATMKAYLKDPSTAPNCKRYKTGKLEIIGLSVIGDRIDSRGKVDRGPLFFNGYGHFTQIAKDMPRWPGYGVNLIQSACFGPSAVLPSEDKIDLKPIYELIKTLDDAAKHNVKVDVLLSTHYFPEWPKQKWPQIATPVGGWFSYSIDMPESKFVIEKFLRIIIPIIKDHPALNSLCLSNEPLFGNSWACANSRGMWNDYLGEHYGDIKTLNTLWKKDYASFNDVPYGQSYDWWAFSQERFAAWHKWVSDVIHEMAPDVPTHSKITMEMGVLNPSAPSSGLDPELFGQASEFNGNDCIIMPDKLGGWGIWWQVQNMAYDMQRSFVKKPIFNSENHITHDGWPDYVPPQNFQMTLWQGAIHGQGATTIWVWERTWHEGPWEPSFFGNVIDHPLCAQAVGTTNLDLNRFASEVTALQNAKAPVAIYWCKATSGDRNYLGTLQQAYESLNFCGLKVDFISDRQLARGEGANYKMILLPNTHTVLTEDYNAIKKLAGKVKLVNMGKSLETDPYGNAYPADEVAKLRTDALNFSSEMSGSAMWPAIMKELDKLKALPEVSVVDAKTGKPIWGVEWLPVKVNGRTVINMVNLLDKPVEVKITSRGKEIMAKNLLSLGGQEKVRLLKPITPVLAEILR